MMMNEVTINTVQGIGDLMWVYRKLAPVYNKITMNVMIVEHSNVQKRALPLIKMFEKVTDVNFLLTNSADYDRLAKQRGIIHFEKQEYDYAINAWLESGVHLNDIDSNPVLWDLNLPMTPVQGLPKEYLLAYVSGSSRHEEKYQLSSINWMHLLINAAEIQQVKDIVFVGAEYDVWKMKEVQSLVQGRLKCHFMLPTLAETISVIKQAKYFVAYQSGLCMLAEEIGTPTFMIWFPELVGMQNTWVRKENIKRRLFKHAFFNYSVDMMLEIMKQSCGTKE